MPTITFSEWDSRKGVYYECTTKEIDGETREKLHLSHMYEVANI